MKLFLLAILIACVAASEFAPSMFDAWVASNGKVYSSPEEFRYRIQVFKSNYESIDRHNSQNLPWKLEMNEFGDLTPEEFLKTRLCVDLPNQPHPFSLLRTRFPERRPLSNLPDEVDWTTKQGVVQPVKDQASCGSCWAFSAIGSTESMIAITTGKSLSLSEQQLVDCSNSYGNHGCSGGWMDYAFKYIKDNGICLEDDYPYKGIAGSCKADECTVAAHIDGFTDVSTSESALQNALVNQPISVAVDAGTWQFYKSGILTNCGSSVNHGVLAVGYGTESGTDFWKIKNSWGPRWGDEGFIRIKRNTGGQGLCAIASHASFPK